MRYPRCAGWAALTFLLAACSFTLDADKYACSKDADCGVPFVCSAHLCKRKPCEDDAQCRAPGGPYLSTFCEEDGCHAAECSATAKCDDDLVCDTDRGQCVAPAAATCTDHEACKRYAEHPVCRDNVCDLAECKKTSECEGADSSPTLECVDGRCDDLIWGCAGEPDERPAPMSATATFKMTILDLLQRKPVEGIQISLCSSLDTMCQTPLNEPEITYDAKGLVTITGLAQNSPIHLKIDAEGFITSDLYIQRLVRDVTVESNGIQLLPTFLYDSLAGSLMVEADLETKATFSALFVDCQEPAKPAAGVTLKIDDKPGLDLADVHYYYVRDGNQPDTNLDKTTVIGAAGAVNVPSGVQITLKGYVGDTVVSSYAITPYAKRMTYVTMYPRVYTVQ
jgi:hypothetical protein